MHEGACVLFFVKLYSIRVVKPHMENDARGYQKRENRRLFYAAMPTGQVYLSYVNQVTIPNQTSSGHVAL